MTADPRAEAREQIARTVFGMDRRGPHINRLWSELDGRQRGPYLRTADAILELVPAVAAALTADPIETDAEAALGQAEEQLRRVRALADEWERPADYTSHYRDGLRDAARAIRRALGDLP
jgi:hypothetical protein